MNDKQPEALRLADALLETVPTINDWDKAAAELRRLHEVNVELFEMLVLALNCHGKMLLSDPPQDAWKYHNVEARIRAVLKKAESK